MRKLKKYTVIFCSILICQYFATGQNIRRVPNSGNVNNLVGMTAPDFILTKYLQAPKNAQLQLSRLKGNVVILEFWATWCAPCRKSMSELSTLAEKFKDKPVIFLAISKEPQAIIDAFLQSRPTTLWVGVDSTGAAHEHYHILTFPQPIVIDKKGQVVAVSSTKEITAERLQSLIEDKPVFFEPTPSIEGIIHRETALIDRSLQRSVLKQVVVNDLIRYPQNTGLNFTTVTNIVTLWKEAYQAYGTFQLDVLGEQDDKDHLYYTPYFVNIRLPQPDKQAIRDTLRNLIERDLLDVRSEMRKKSVWVLQCKNGASPPPPSDALNPELSWERTKFKAVRQPVFALAKYLNTMYNVVDETGLTGEYDLSFTWDLTKKNGLEDGLASLGLEMVKAEREIKVYVIKLKPHLSN